MICDRFHSPAHEVYEWKRKLYPRVVDLGNTPVACWGFLAKQKRRTFNVAIFHLILRTPGYVGVEKYIFVLIPQTQYVVFCRLSSGVGNNGGRWRHVAHRTTHLYIYLSVSFSLSLALSRRFSSIVSLPTLPFLGRVRGIRGSTYLSPVSQYRSETVSLGGGEGGAC